MPNIKSAKKRVLVAKKKTLTNKIYKNTLRTVLKDFEAAAASGEKAAAEAAYKTAVKKLDKAVAKGILHKNNASRKKSKLALKLSSVA